MTININTPALLFPAISLLMLAYTNRFLALAQIIRQLNAKRAGATTDSVVRQIRNLIWRINLIKAMQAAGVASMLLCVIAMLFLFYDRELGGQVCFTISLVLMTGSLVLSLWEILLSGNALKIELEDLRREQEEEVEIKPESLVS